MIRIFISQKTFILDTFSGKFGFNFALIRRRIPFAKLGVLFKIIHHSHVRILLEAII